MDTLFAKSYIKEKEKITLIDHSLNTFRFADSILTKIEKCKLPKKVMDNWNDIKKTVKFTALLHDLGKANNIFQSMLCNSSIKNTLRIHPIRHEILSMLVLKQVQNEFSIILRNNTVFNSNLLDIASWIVGGHHLRLKTVNNPLLRIPGNPQGYDFIFYGSNPDVNHLLKSALKIFKKKSNSNSLMNNINFKEIKNSEYSLMDICDNLEDFLDKAMVEEDMKIVLSISKSLLIVSDIIASSFEKLSLNSSEWIEESFGNLLNEEDLKKIIIAKIGSSEYLHEFQQNMGKSNSRITLVTAGCGNGKTIGAYEWARTHAVGKKLFFCYPTTGTTSAGFKDYLLAQTDIERSLLHSRSSVDLNLMITDAEENYKKEELESSLLQDAISCWGKKVIACTADVVLGIIQNHRNSIINLPLFFNSAFIFDEIHSYDSDLFGALLRFIKVFDDVPILLMSASIQQNRSELLKKVINDEIKFINGVPELETFPRYLIESTREQEKCWDIISQAINNSAKILFVCNTVNSALEKYEKACNLFKDNKNIFIEIYHSRFRYRDRVAKQRNVLSLFNEHNSDSCLVISTQVCEMSLDISADLLITEICPFPILIQRLGRLNRRGKRIMNTEERANCILFNNDQSYCKPYGKDEILLCQNIIKPLIGKVLNQNLLAKTLDLNNVKENFKEHSSWLDDPGFNEIGSLRKSDYTIEIILEEDRSNIEYQFGTTKPSVQQLKEWTIPMIYKKGIDYSILMAGFPVISNQFINYDEKKGAKWR